MYVYVYVYVCACACAYAYAYVYVYVYVSMSMSMYFYVCLYCSSVSCFLGKVDSSSNSYGFTSLPQCIGIGIKMDNICWLFGGLNHHSSIMKTKHYYH